MRALLPFALFVSCSYSKKVLSIPVGYCNWHDLYTRGTHEEFNPHCISSLFATFRDTHRNAYRGSLILTW